jgi:hypothetical protein
VLANELDLRVLDSALCISLGIGLDVAEVADVSVRVTRSTVALAEGIEVRASGGAAVGVVAELMNVETALGVGVMACDVVGDGGGAGLGGLLEGHGAGDLGVAAEDSNCRWECG